MTELIELTSDHLSLVLISLVFSSVIAFGFVFWFEYFPRLKRIILPILSIIYTIPSLALFVLLIPFLGLGRPTAIVTLVLYAVFILTSGFATALDNVQDSIIDSAKGMGFDPIALFFKVKCIYALPQLLSSLRLATISLIGITSIASVINAGGLGILVFQGLNQQRYDKVLSGAFSMAILSILFNYIFSLSEKEALAYIRGEKNDD